MNKLDFACVISCCLFFALAIIITNPIVYYYWYVPESNRYSYGECMMINCTQIIEPGYFYFYTVYNVTTLDYQLSYENYDTDACNLFLKKRNCNYEKSDPHGTLEFYNRILDSEHYFIWFNLIAGICFISSCCGLIVFVDKKCL